MTATLTAKIEWAVMWVVDGDTMGDRFKTAEGAASLVRYLESQGVECWLDRIESFTADDADRGIAVGSEWIATPGIEPGQLWERLADATLNQDALTGHQWSRMAIARNELGSRRPGLDGNPLGKSARNEWRNSGTVQYGVLLNAPLTRRPNTTNSGE